MHNAKLTNGSLKAIAALSSGALIAQLLTFACSPLLTRLYTVEQVGLFTFVLSVVSMFSGVICLRFDVTLVTSGSDGQFGALLKLCAVLTLALSAIVGGLAIVYAYATLGSSDWWVAVFVFPLLVIAGAINILNACNNRSEKYGVIGRAYAKRSVAQNSFMVLGGLILPGTFTLLFSQLFGQISGIAEQFKGLGDDWKKGARASRADAAAAAIDNKSQALFSAPATLLNAASYSLVSLCVGDIFGMAALGLYSVSYRVLGAPLTIFSSNIAKVHCKQAEKDIARTSNYFRCTVRMILLSVVIIAPIAFLLFAFSPPAFSFFFGSDWYSAGVYVQMLVPMFCLRFVAGSIGFGFFLSGKQRQEMVIQALLLVSLIAVVVATKACGFGMESFLYLLSFVWSLIYAAEIGLCILNSRKGHR